jgi:hypothetical protein
LRYAHIVGQLLPEYTVSPPSHCCEKPQSLFSKLGSPVERSRGKQRTEIRGKYEWKIAVAGCDVTQTVVIKVFGEGGGGSCVLYRHNLSVPWFSHGRQPRPAKGLCRYQQPPAAARVLFELSPTRPRTLPHSLSKMCTSSGNWQCPHLEIRSQAPNKKVWEDRTMFVDRQESRFSQRLSTAVRNIVFRDIKTYFVHLR